MIINYNSNKSRGNVTFTEFSEKYSIKSRFACENK